MNSVWTCLLFLSGAEAAAVKYQSPEEVNLTQKKPYPHRGRCWTSSWFLWRDFYVHLVSTALNPLTWKLTTDPPVCANLTLHRIILCKETSASFLWHVSKRWCELVLLLRHMQMLVATATISKNEFLFIQTTCHESEIIHHNCLNYSACSSLLSNILILVGETEPDHSPETVSGRKELSWVPAVKRTHVSCESEGVRGEEVKRKRTRAGNI